MSDVTKEMQNSIPSSFDTDINANIGSNLKNSLSNNNNSNNYNNNLIEDFKTALSQMKIELDDEVAGKFVKKTVEDAIYV